MGDILLFIIIGVIGVMFGRRMALRRQCSISEQSKQKAENKEKILEFLRENPNQPGADGQVKKIKNNDVERLVGVSNATAERYLDELEKEGKLVQHGKIGQSVFYTLK